MTIDSHTIYPYQMDDQANLYRSKQTFPNDYEICIWMLHTSSSTIKKNMDRDTYFRELQRIKKTTNTHRNVHIHSILNICSTNPQRLPKHDSGIQKILQERKDILESEIDWNKFHILTSDLLDELPTLARAHHSIAEILNTTEIRPAELSKAYYQPSGWIYCIINIAHHQKIKYIGQHGMHRRKIWDRNKLWQELERTPLQRFQEHIRTARDKDRRENKKSSTLSKHMQKDPHNWIMIPLAKIPFNIRKENLKIEDRWPGWRRKLLDLQPSIQQLQMNFFKIK